MIKSILFSELVSIMVVIAILIVIPTIQLQPLQNRQALAQNITLTNKSGNLTGLMIALNTVGVNNNSINNISSTLHGEEQQQQSPLSITKHNRWNSKGTTFSNNKNSDYHNHILQLLPLQLN